MYIFEVDEKLENLIKSVIKDFMNLKIPISNSINFKNCKGIKTYGLCMKSNNIDFKYIIKINVFLLLEQDIKNTIAHELLHTINNYKYSAHKGNWKKWADYVNKNSNYNITITNNYRLKDSTYLMQSVFDMKEYNHNTMNVGICPLCKHNIGVSKKVIPSDINNFKYKCKNCKKNYYTILPKSILQNSTMIEKQNFVDNIITNKIVLDEDFIKNDLPYLNKSLCDKLILSLLEYNTNLFLNYLDRYRYIYPILNSCSANIIEKLAKIYVNDKIAKLKNLSYDEFVSFSNIFSLTSSFNIVDNHYKSNLDY